MKTIQKRISAILIFLGALGAAIVGIAQSIPQPGITITNLGTNTFSVKITNSVATADYDLLWTPELGSSEFPWTWAEIGTPGQSNFVVSASGYDSAYFRVLLDTNTIPLWEAADPNNPGAGKLTITITSPAQGAIIQ